MRLILLSLVRKDPKTFFRHRGVLGIEPVHCGSSGILFVPFFCGKGVYVDVVVVF